MLLLVLLFVLATLLLMPPPTLASCSYSTTVTTDSCCNGAKFGEASSNGLVSFAVESGGVVTCSVACSSAGALFYLKLDGIASDTNFDADGATSCPSTPDEFQYIAPAETSGVSFYIYGDANSDYAIDCSCDQPGTTPTPTSSDPDGSNGCFSATSTVQVRDQGRTQMKDLQLGGYVLTGNQQYQQVYSFGHRQEGGQSETFFQIYTTSNDTHSHNPPLEMTGNHLIFVMDATDQTIIKTKRADRLQVGDFLVDSNQQVIQVTQIASTLKSGLYMPLTPDGTIVVNGILASTYVSIDGEAPAVVETTGLFPFLSSEQDLLHWWLSPYRLFCIGVSSEFCSRGPRKQQASDDGILPWLKLGRHLAKTVESKSLWVKVVIGAPIFWSLQSSTWQSIFSLAHPWPPS
ncbi:Desert hedgehog protein [Seminavis robusta]|uniref:Desert hedgehog protein n=1 Tax=Seminavis robusta TaxID=568900 RepID=A0A9N8ECQ1_9STRA|nr:Desert hedgehog protein [Seminavis robusta]|eukprot:Sro898_g217600.1 Desert hedgehog protein (404) ;mRNA; r:23006-24217